jgi:hypothetical protein
VIVIECLSITKLSQGTYKAPFHVLLPAARCRGLK